MIRVSKKRQAQFGTWVSGSVSDQFGLHVSFEAKVFKAPSVFGIPTPRFEEGGNVSKLCLRAEDGRELYCWERALGYVDPGFEDEAEDAVHEIVAYLENEFCQ